MLLQAFRHRIHVIGPVVEGGRIEVCTVGPNQSLNFWIDAHRVENSRIAQRAKKLTEQDGTKVDGSLETVIEADA